VFSVVYNACGLGFLMYYLGWAKDNVLHFDLVFKQEINEIKTTKLLEMYHFIR